MIQKVDDVLDAGDTGGYDPFLCAQDIPETYTIPDLVVVSGDSAEINVQTDLEGHEFTVFLQRFMDRWMITDIQCKGGE
jgi:hypothetical protein